MATHISDLAAAVGVLAALPPVSPGAAVTGDAVDLIGSDGECFAVQTVGAFDTGPTWTGRIEQSADASSWSTLATFPAVTAANSTQTIRFARTARYLRYNSAVSGGTPDLTLAVLIGQARKTF